MSTQSTLKKIKLNESTISMVLGALVIIVVGVLVINYFKSRDAGETIPAAQTEDISLQSRKHIVATGEGLWAIAETYYENGDNWVHIARVNNISDPNNIEEGQELIIPDLSELLAEAQVDNEEAVEPTNEPEATATNTPTPEPTQEPEDDNDNENNEEAVTDEDEEEAETEEADEPTNTLTPTEEPEATPTIEPTPEPEQIAEAEGENKIEGEKYTVVSGDSLWTIAERAYGDGMKWVSIAEANDLVNPNVIHSGNEFVLPR